MAKQDKNTEQNILDAAVKLFTTKGYASTSTTEIAKEAGCNQALVHYYYRSKENLFNLVFEKKAGLVVSSLLQVNDESLSFEEKLKIRIALHFDFLKVNNKLPIFFFSEIATDPVRVKSLFEKVGGLLFSVLINQIQTEIDAEIEKGTIRKIDAANLLFSILSLNVMTFLTAPLMKVLLKVSDEQFDVILEERKAENIRIMLNNIRP